MLTAISPIDGRYESKTKELIPYFSEYALIKERVFVEIQYFLALSELNLPQFPALTASQKVSIEKLYENFNVQDAEAIKNIEKTTNHDVKAVEYWLKERWDELGLGDSKEFIHFGLTSQDINNTATPILLQSALDRKSVV